MILRMFNHAKKFGWNFICVEFSVSSPKCWNFRKARDFVYLCPTQCIDCTVASRCVHFHESRSQKFKVLLLGMAFRSVSCSVHEICYSTLIGWSFCESLKLIWSTLMSLSEGISFGAFHYFKNSSKLLIWYYGFSLDHPQFSRTQNADMRSR